MPPGISASDFYYILPELVLTAGALLVLIADVALPRSPRASHAALSWLTLAVIGATLVSLCAVRQHAGGSGARPDRGRSVRAVLQDPLPRRCRHDGADVDPVSRGRRRAAGRVLLPHSLRDARHDDHGGRHRSHHDLHRPRDDGDLVLHPDRLHQAEPAVE